MQVFTLDVSFDNPHFAMSAGRWQLRATSQGLYRIVLPTRRREIFPEDEALIAPGEWKTGFFAASPITMDVTLASESAYAHLHAAVQQLTEYFNAERQKFTIPLAPAPLTSFQELIHQTIAKIPYGNTWSYAELAQAAGAAKAVRAVGTACGVNPLPIIVPCHRVIRGDGSPGNYTGGAEYKRALLTLEGSAF